MCRIPSDAKPQSPPVVHVHTAVASEKPTEASSNPNIKKLGFIWAGVIVALLLIICTIVVVIVGLDIQQKQKQKRNENINKTLANPVALAITDKNAEVKSLESVVRIINRKEWKSLQANDNIPELKQPVKYVILCHTSGRFCKTNKNCTAVIKWIQNYYITTLKKPDILYNFLLGGDGNIYEGRGWTKQNDLMNNSITIGVIGNYVYDILTKEMIEKTKNFLKYSVKIGILDKDYFLVSHNQTRNTLSPGLNIYREIKSWDHYTFDYIAG